MEKNYNQIESIFNCNWESIKKKMYRISRGERKSGQIIKGQIAMSIGGKDLNIQVWMNGFKHRNIFGENVCVPTVFATVEYEYGWRQNVDYSHLTEEGFKNAVITAINGAMNNFLMNN